MELIVNRYERTDGYPRPEGRSLSLTDLRAADVLLSRGTTDVSNAIVAADGGSYSHAALWTGTSIVEATLDGISEHPFTGDRDVYRHRLLDAEAAVEVVRVARAQLGKQYAYTELLTLGVLFTLGVRPQRPILSLALRALGGTRAKNLENWLQRHSDGRAPRVCTELVAVSFFRVQQGKFALQIVPRSLRPAAANSGQRRLQARQPDSAFALPQGVDSSQHYDDLDDLNRSCATLLMNLPRRDTCVEDTDEIPLARPEKVLWGSLAVSSDTEVGLGSISPADLQFSLSLEFIGRMSATNSDGT